MKFRILLLLIFLLPVSRITAQLSEEVYSGTVIRAGYIDDASYGPFNIGFSFTYYGNTYTQFYVNSNGMILFGAGSSTGAEAPIPTATAPNNFIAAFWDDLVVDGTGKILYTTIGAAPNRKLIIQFNNMGFYSPPPFMGSFTVILQETSNIIKIQDRLIVDNTSDRAHGGSATIGIENSDGTAGVQYAYHNTTAVNTGKAISFTPNGLTYTLNSDDYYDGVFLTSNLLLPEPGIPALLAPPQNSVIGSNYPFIWSDGGNSASYQLLLSDASDLGGAAYYSPGFNTTYNITGLTLNSTYYWGVFASNATGTTWCEIKKFSTSASAVLAPVPQTVWIKQNADKTIRLLYTGGNSSPKTAIITSLPVSGQLYQYNAGSKGSPITAVPATVTDPGMNVIYSASGAAGNGAGNFNFKVNDSGGDSPDGTITVNVNPPDIPDVLYVAKNANVEIQFDVAMADPAGKQNEFTVKVNSVSATITSASLKPGDPKTIVLTLASPLAGTETVLVSYTQGTVTGSTGGTLLSFTDQSVTLKAQTLTFPLIPDKELNDPPFNPGATTSSSLAITYSSSNQPVATAAGSLITVHNPGISIITAYQPGNGVYAPGRYNRSLTVNLIHQTITFTALPEKIYGNADFTISATATSGLPVSFASDNASVATVSGNTVHIAGAGTAVITASQSGDATHSAAPPVTQTLTVNKAVLTCTADNKTKDYLAAIPALTYQITGFVNGENQSVIDNLPVAGTTCLVNSPAGVYPITITGGNDNNYSFVFVAGTLTVLKINQTITITDYPQKLLYHDTYTLGATSTSGLTVLFESSDVSILSVAGNVVTGLAKGNATVRAYNNGDQNYYPAEATISFEVYTTHRDILHLFTPNNDGFNDYWELPDLASWGKCDVRVFNRWGKLVYSNPDYNNLWDGTSSGSPLPEGAYYFIIKTQNAGVVKGMVNIVR